MSVWRSRIPLLVVLMTFVACNKETATYPPPVCGEQTKTPCMVDSTKPNIRVWNNSMYSLCNVHINSDGPEADYGTIAAGDTTCYVPFDSAYGYGFVQLFIDDNKFVLRPTDYVGETRLEPGKYTYIITVTDYESRWIHLESKEDP